MYSNGQGVDQSDERAKEYYEAAAKQGHAGAQNNLGTLYANGRGVEKSFETARKWWMKSAEQGVESAIEGLTVQKMYSVVHTLVTKLFHLCDRTKFAK